MYSKIATLSVGMLLGAIAIGFYTQQPASKNLQAEMHVNHPQPDLEAPSVLESATSLQEMENQLQLLAEGKQLLEDRLRDFSNRLTALEAMVSSKFEASDHTEATQLPDDTAKESQTPVESLTLSHLLDAGIDESLATNIIQREAESEMQKLELRDQAKRDGSFGTEEYYRMLSELNGNAPALREEIGDDAYDRFLYATGQPNRVAVSSVIPGSPAEQAGIRQGDMILSYGDSRIFNWSELREVTTQGERSEYIEVKIQRESESVSLLLPRGPLGVRLDTSREAPEWN